MSRRPPPPPKAKPGQVQVVRAVYPYKAQQADELNFDEGETLYILEKSDSGWWEAKTSKGKQGLIPANYIEESTETIENALHEAAKRGNLPFLQECLSNKVSVNGLDKSGSTALHWAAAGGHIECAKILLGIQNVEVNVQNKLGDTPLHNAAWKGHPEIVEMLLERGARKDIKNNEKQTPYTLAAKNPECGRFLADHKTAAEEYDETAEDSD